jgi:hypothetical protein
MKLATSSSQNSELHHHVKQQREKGYRVARRGNRAAIRNEKAMRDSSSLYLSAYSSRIQSYMLKSFFLSSGSIFHISYPLHSYASLLSHGPISQELQAQGVEACSPGVVKTASSTSTLPST